MENPPIEKPRPDTEAAAGSLQPPEPAKVFLADPPEVIERIRREERRFMAVRRDLKERRKSGLVPDELNSVLGDPEIPEDLRFEVWLFDAVERSRPRRQVPFEVCLARTPGGRRVMRKQGMRVPPPQERHAWDAWVREGGPRPDGKPEEPDESRS